MRCFGFGRGVVFAVTARFVGTVNQLIVDS